MGLDGVELVMALEEAFGVSISDGDAGQAVTPRMVGDIIFSKLQATDEATCQSQRAFYLLRKAFIRRFNLNRTAVAPDMTFRKLIPVSAEPQSWQELKNEIHVRSWPALVRPRWMVWLLTASAGAVFLGSFWMFYKIIPAGAALAAILGAVLALATNILSIRLTNRFKVRIPHRIKTLRDIVPYAITSDQIKWTREQVSDVVKKIILEQLGIPETQYREDAHFVKDIGLG
jgi:acyl carrier protein